MIFQSTAVLKVQSNFKSLSVNLAIYLFIYLFICLSLQDVLAVFDIDLKLSFLELGGNSFLAVSLIDQLEEALKLPLPDLLDTLLSKSMHCGTNIN